MLEWKEIYCPDCGVLIRRATKNGPCPECGNPQAIMLPWKETTNVDTMEEEQQ
jgi:hypothetical protein